MEGHPTGMYSWEAVHKNFTLLKKCLKIVFEVPKARMVTPVESTKDEI